MDFGKTATPEEIKEVLNENEEEEGEEEEEEEVEKDKENDNKEEPKEDNKKEGEDKEENKDKKEDNKKENTDNKEEKQNNNEKQEEDKKEKKEEVKKENNNTPANNEAPTEGNTQKTSNIQTTQAETTPNSQPTNQTEGKENKPKKKKKSKKKLALIEEEKSEASVDIFIPNPETLFIAVIGYEKSGKTSFIRKYAKNLFDKMYVKTIGVIENKDRLYLHKDKNIQLVLIDTPPIPKNGTCEIVQEQISRSHIIIYIYDITEEDALFKIRLNFTNFDFKPKQIVAIIGNNIDKISKFSGENKALIINYCNEKKMLCDFISCAKSKTEEIENLVEKKIINYYFEKYDKN